MNINTQEEDPAISKNEKLKDAPKDIAITDPSSFLLHAEVPFREDLLKLFIDRYNKNADKKPLLLIFDDVIFDDLNSPIFIHGPSGIGKSTILMDFLKRISQRMPQQTYNAFDKYNYIRFKPEEEPLRAIDEQVLISSRWVPKSVQETTQSQQENDEYVISKEELELLMDSCTNFGATHEKLDSLSKSLDDWIRKSEIRMKVLDSICKE
jgi:hypothetical protein